MLWCNHIAHIETAETLCRVSHRLIAHIEDRIAPAHLASTSQVDAPVPGIFPEAPADLPAVATIGPMEIVPSVMLEEPAVEVEEEAAVEAAPEPQHTAPSTSQLAEPELEPEPEPEAAATGRGGKSRKTTGKGGSPSKRKTKGKAAASVEPESAPADNDMHDTADVGGAMVLEGQLDGAVAGEFILFFMFHVAATLLRDTVLCCLIIFFC